LLGATASTAQSAATGPPVCPTAYHVFTLEEALVRYAPFATEQEIRSGFANFDANGNGFACSKLFVNDRFFPEQLGIDDLYTGPR